MLRTILIFASVFSVGLAQGFYKVIGSREIRPNSEYHAAISTQATSQPTIVDVTIVGVSDSGRPFSTQESVAVLPYSSETAKLQVRDIDPGEYKLLVEGRGGISFRSSYPLQFVKKSYSVFIQTDKAVYKPGNKIQFRAIILNPQLKPAAIVRQEPITVFIGDGQGDKVKQWKNVIVPNGVFTNELQLSERPVLGQWNITVVVHGQIFNKTIEVADYILPKFLIKIDTPTHMTFKENILVAQIKSQYDYGKNVRGDATVTVYPTIYSGVIQPIFRTPIRKVVPIDGSATIQIDIANELKLSDEFERTVIVDVTIEEALTGRRQNNSAIVHLHKYDYNMEIIKTSYYYKPGLKYTAYVKVSNYDGSPLEDDKREVTVKHGYSRVNEVYEPEKRVLNKNGIVKLELYPPKNSTNETALRIEAEYLDLKERMSPVPSAISPSNTFLQASILTENPQINKDIEVMVNCTEPMKYINYEILGRGDIHTGHSFQISDKKEFKFHFTVTHDMIPVTHLLVNYIRDNGELVADSVDIEIEDGLLQNFVEVQTNTGESQPGVDLDITIKSEFKSYISLLAVDENSQKLRSGYDITHTEVADELNSYDVAAVSPYSALMKGTNSQFFWKPGGSNTQDMFHASGALLMTNGLVSSHRPTLEDIYLRPVSYGSSTVKPDRGAGLAVHTVTRPPLAGPYAFSRIPRPVWDKPKVYLAQDIADTWLFTNFSLGIEGKTSMRRKLPNTLNTWLITAFSLHPVYGLGLVKNPTKIKVSKPFVVTLDLPQMIRRDEIVAIPVVVYNHIDKDITAEVTIYNQEQKFEFAEVSNEVNSTSKVEVYRRKRISVKANSGAAVSFMVIPVTLGDIDIKVRASSTNSQDSITKQLIVRPEGEPQRYTKTVLIDLRKSSSYKGNITFEIPKNVIPDSEMVEVSAVGDLLGPAIINLEQLIPLPTGCGEQNLVHFMPNLIVLNYLINTRQLTPPIEKEAIMNLETAYQQQLTYKRPDGSFSAFGNMDDNGSVWLTAYVAQAFKLASPYIFVDDNITMTALKWLNDKQASNGSFVEEGSIVHQDVQSNDGKSLALTAFTLIAFIENQNSMYTNTINKGLNYIAKNLDESENIYTIAICSYVLQLTRHAAKQSALNLLDSKAKTGNDTKWWAKDIPKNEENNPWNSLPKSLDIETTAYGLLTFLEANLLDDALPVVNWMVEQQNGFGGFVSSQDTVIGLQALHKLVTKFSAISNMQIDYKYGNGEASRFSINTDNALIVQKNKVQNDVRQINITAQGRGLALFRVSYQYNMNVTGPWPMFTLDPQVDKNSNANHLQLSVCTAFVSRNLSEKTLSNMAVMEVNFPSGFTADLDALPSLEVSQNVRRVETKNGDTTVVLYFNNLTVQEYCPTVSAFRTHKVANQKSIHVIVYDYYDSSRRARIFYKGRTANLCDICEDEDCGDICTQTDYQKNAESKDRGGATSINSSWICVVVLTFTSSIIYRA